MPIKNERMVRCRYDEIERSCSIIWRKPAEGTASVAPAADVIEPSDEGTSRNDRSTWRLTQDREILGRVPGLPNSSWDALTTSALVPDVSGDQP